MTDRQPKPSCHEHAAADRAAGSALREVMREVVREEVREALEELKRALATGKPSDGSTDSGFLSANQAAAIAGVEPATVREWVKRGHLRRHSAGRLLRVRRDELEMFLARGPMSDPDRKVESLAAALLAKGCKKQE